MACWRATRTALDRWARVSIEPSVSCGEDLTETLTNEESILMDDTKAVEAINDDTPCDIKLIDSLPKELSSHLALT